MISTWCSQDNPCGSAEALTVTAEATGEWISGLEAERQMWRPRAVGQTNTGRMAQGLLSLLSGDIFRTFFWASHFLWYRIGQRRVAFVSVRRLVTCISYQLFWAGEMPIFPAIITSHCIRKPKQIDPNWQWIRLFGCMHHREETRTFSIIFLYSGQGGQACNS